MAEETQKSTMKKRLIPRKRTPKPPHVPAYHRSNHGLEQLAKDEDVSYATLYRLHVTLNQSIPEALSHCRENGLTYITRGQPRLGLRRRRRPTAPSSPASSSPVPPSTAAAAL